MNAVAEVANSPIFTVEDLIHRLGDIPPNRIRLRPAPGEASVRDAAKAERCELIDGVLVEKAMGFEESEITSTLIILLGSFVRRHKLGKVMPPDAMVELLPNQVRIPDVAFFSNERLAKKKKGQAVPKIAPNLAIEVLGKGNTKKEMDRKLRDYFEAGVETVWLVDSVKQTVRVCSGAGECITPRSGDVLKGDPTVPGFSVSVDEVFADD
ncbi:MAG: Uma2 family endonuclease [Gemmataceae bacterium]|nr:Uma2 family endonuclease [Gemmataceae bacterium]